VENNRQFNRFYGIPLFGGLLMLISVFLTWYTIKISDTTLAQEFSISGLGNTDSTSSIAKITAQEASSAGFLVIFFGGIILLMAILGLWLNKKGFAISLIVFGVLAVGFTALKVSQANESVELLVVSGGIGVYLALLGAIVVFAGSIVSLVKTDK
jgi:succinate-acetate transporter protein